MIEAAEMVAAYAALILLLVGVHEGGHYLAARSVGLVADRFSFGFGPALVRLTDRRGTQWTLSALPLGGYVSFPLNTAGRPAFDALPLRARTWIVFAGPLANLILAFTLFTGLAYWKGYDVARPVIVTVVEGGPAAAAGLSAGDRVTSIAGYPVHTAADARRLIMLRPGETVEIGVAGRKNPTAARLGDEAIATDQGTLHVGILGASMPTRIEPAASVTEAARTGIRNGIFMAYAQLVSLKQIASAERSVTELSGPVRIAKAAKEHASQGLATFAMLAALVSTALAVINLLPIPALDGGHLATYALEAARGQPLGEVAERRLGYVGLAVIVLLGAVAIAGDIIVLYLR